MGGTNQIQWASGAITQGACLPGCEQAEPCSSGCVVSPLLENPGEIEGGDFVLQHLGNNEQLFLGDVGDVS